MAIKYINQESHFKNILVTHLFWSWRTTFGSILFITSLSYPVIWENIRKYWLLRMNLVFFVIIFDLRMSSLNLFSSTELILQFRHCKEFPKLTFWALALRQTEWQRANAQTTALELFRWRICIINLFGKTKLPCYTFPPTQRYSFFGNLPPSLLWFRVETVVWRCDSCLSSRLYWI